MSEEIAGLRRTLMWNRSAMMGIVLIIAWLMFMLVTEFRVMRNDFTELRVQTTELSERVQVLDQYGGRAMRDHELKAHDRAH